MPKPLNLTPEEKQERQAIQNRLHQQKWRANQRIKEAGESKDKAIAAEPVTSETLAMPVDPDSDPQLTSPSQSIDLKRLRELAGAGNDISLCAAALSTTPTAIEEAIAPTMWADYSLDALKAGEAAIRLALHRRAVLGDSRAMELLAEQEKRQQARAKEDTLGNDIRKMSLADVRKLIDEVKAVLNYRKPLQDVLEGKHPTVKVVGTIAPLPPSPQAVNECQQAEVELGLSLDD